MGGLYDAFILQFDPGRGRKWGSYFGGSASDQAIQVVGYSDHIYIVGNTESSDLYVCTSCNPPDPLLEDASYNGGDWDMFIAKFDRTGLIDPANFSGTFATYFGGSGGEHVGAMTVDDNGNVYIGGYVTDDSYSDFPVVTSSTGYDQSFGQSSDYSDAFFIKIDANNDVTWCTAIGGNSGSAANKPETITGMAVDLNDNLYVTGTTASSGPSTIPAAPITSNTSGLFPLADPNTSSSTDFMRNNSGGLDAIVMKYDTGGEIEWATMHGGDEDENYEPGTYYFLGGIAVSADGNIFITGGTSSDTYGNYPDFPHVVLSGVTGRYDQSSYGGDGVSVSGDVFLAMFDQNFELKWSTY